MKKSELKKGCSFFEKRSDREKETYLTELGGSVHNYIRTGVKNRQLDDWLTREEEFQQQYEKRLDISKIIDAISENSKELVAEELVAEIEKSEYQHKLKTSADLACVQEACNSLIMEASTQIIDIVTDIVNEKLPEVLKDVAYLSHMNMLYELYEREEKIRREEQEYEKMSERFQYLANVTQQLSEKKRMELEEVQCQTQLTEDELKMMLENCGKYFNMRDRNNGIQVSLSPAGKKYNNYNMNLCNRYTAEMLNQLVYKNCDNLMDSIERTCVRGIEREPKFEHISPDKERSLLLKYDSMIKKIATECEGIHVAYIIAEEKREVDENEKNMYRIPRIWNE